MAEFFVELLIPESLQESGGISANTHAEAIAKMKIVLIREHGQLWGLFRCRGNGVVVEERWNEQFWGREDLGALPSQKPIPPKKTSRKTSSPITQHTLF